LAKALRYTAALLCLIAACIQLVPSSWLRARPKGDSRGVALAVVLGFGYEETNAGEMKPGAANEFLLNWALENHPAVETVLVQEGVWAVICETGAATCEADGVELLRIHRHDPHVDVNTLDTAVCAIEAIERMDGLREKKALLVAHDLQLWRVAADFERARQDLCSDCEFVIPDVPDTPYPARSVQWRTRNEPVYRFVEIVARFRDSRLFTPETPHRCIAPLADDRRD
jgi:hypothetical protein